MLLLLSSSDEQGVGGYAFLGGMKVFSRIYLGCASLYLFFVFLFFFLGGGDFAGGCNFCLRETT